MKKTIFIVLFLQSILVWSQIALPIQQSNIPKNHLVVNYDFSNPASFSGTGNSVNNLASTTTASATLLNSPGFIKTLGYASFNGVNQYIITPDLKSYFKSVAATTIQNSHTISLWVYPLNANGIILSEFGSGSISSGWQDSQIEMVNGFLKFRVWPGAENLILTSTNTIALNQWHHIVMVYDGANLKGYVDGVLQGTKTYARSAPMNNNTGLHYGIGAFTSTHMGSAAYGKFHLAQFKLYNIPLSNTDIAQEYSREKAKYEYEIHSPDTNTNPNYWSVSSAWNSTTGSTGSSDPFSGLHYTPWLNSGLGWVAQTQNTSQFIILNYDEPVKMTGIISQGRANNGGQWVSSAHIDVSMNGTSWTRLISNATLNSNSTEDVKLLFPTPVLAKYVRVNPLTWNNYICMRLGVIVEPEPMISDGLVLRLDAANSKSYPGSGTTWNDLSGNGSHVTLTSTSYSPAVGGSIVFNGTSSYANFNAAIGNTNTVTVDMWVKTNSLNAPTGSMYFGFGLYDVWTKGGNIGFNTSGGDLFGLTSTRVESLGIEGAWKHLVFVMNSGSVINNKIYVNGVNQTSLSQVYSGFNSTNANFNSGAGRIAGWRNDFNWLMNLNVASFKIYNRELSQHEITNNFNNTKPLFFPENSGLSPETASTSAYQIKQDYPDSEDGFYWIKNPNINSGNPIKIYADMTTEGGGWTLILKNSSYVGWTYANAIARNTSIPFTTNADIISTSTSNYSIIAWADHIKQSASGFQYMIDAGSRRSFGGIWTANDTYSFVSNSGSNTNVTENKKFGNWNYVGSNNGMALRMPWYGYVGGSTGFYTLSSGTLNWWGTLIANNSAYSPSPWISDAGGGTSNQNPGIIWYWVR
jgi:hypothetical protein